MDRSSARPDYLKWLASPTVVIAAGIYVLAFMIPPFWVAVVILVLMVMMVIGAYAWWDLDKKVAEEAQRYGPNSSACEICGITVHGMAYEQHMWDAHPQEARALKRLTFNMIWWALGISAAEAVLVTVSVGWSLASLVAYLVAGPFIAFLASVGITLQVLWPRRAAKARREWMKTHASPLRLELEQR